MPPENNQNPAGDSSIKYLYINFAMEYDSTVEDPEINISIDTHGVESDTIANLLFAITNKILNQQIRVALANGILKNKISLENAEQIIEKWDVLENRVDLPVVDSSEVFFR